MKSLHEAADDVAGSPEQSMHFEGEGDTRMSSPFWKGQHTVPMLCRAEDGVLCGVFIMGTSPCSDRAAVRCFAGACSKEGGTRQP